MNEVHLENIKYKICYNIDKNSHNISDICFFSYICSLLISILILLSILKVIKSLQVKLNQIVQINQELLMFYSIFSIKFWIKYQEYLYSVEVKSV